MLKKLAALVNLVGILTATAVLVLLYRTATAVPGAVDWNLVSGFVQTFWPFLATLGGLFLVTALITTMHTLFPPPPPPPPGPDPQLLATLENARLKIRDLETEVQEGETRQTAFQAEAARAQARVTELEGSLAHVTNELNSFKETESTLANDYQRAQERATELNTELIGAVDRRRALEAERDQLQRELGEIREDLARTQAALQTAQAAARAAAQTADQARAEAKAEAARALLAKPAPTPPV
ncbi:MAG: hypothetical protein GX442_21655, partial [Candidatus Riflebacteria bacterium]|nr:hypothetical protein [Candidatus Riflebacteria bacterium]